MFSILKRSFLFFVLSFFVVNVHAQQKIGYVNFQDIFKKYPATQVAKDSISNYEKRLREQYDFEVKALQDKLEFYRCADICWAKGGIEAAEKEIRQKKEAIDKIPTENEEKILQKEKTLLSPINSPC